MKGMKKIKTPKKVVRELQRDLPQLGKPAGAFEKCFGLREIPRKNNPVTAQKLNPKVKKAFDEWVTRLLTDPLVINFNGRKRVIR